MAIGSIHLRIELDVLSTTPFLTFPKFVCIRALTIARAKHQEVLSGIQSLAEEVQNRRAALARSREVH